MSKIIDGTIGFIIGDCMGVPIEFSMREKCIKNPVSKMLSGGTHGMPAGSWSDDTSMTIATMDSIIQKKSIDYKDIMDKFLTWVEKEEYTPTGFRFDTGHTCAGAIYTYFKHKDLNPIECGLTGEYENGNGSLMRMLPIAYYCFYKKLNDKEIIKLVNDISSLTHGHEISKLGCYIYVRFIMFLLDGKDKLSAYSMIKCIDYSMYSAETLNRYYRILKNDISKYELDEINSSAFVVDTLEACLWVLLNTDNYSQSIVGAINLGQDTDTIGAITGSMSGIIYGYNNMPSKWVNAIIKKDYLFDLINKFENELCNSKKDAVLGAIIGDIVGSRFELNNCKSINYDFMPENKCRFTDDTVMTLAIAKSLIDCENDYTNLSELAINNMVEIGRKHIRCGFGPSFYKWITAEKHEPYNSYGNGAAMRVSACGMVAKSIKEVKELSLKVTGVSHNHPDGIKGAEAVAMMVFLIKNGKSKEKLKECFVKNYYSLDYNLKEINKDHRFKVSCEATVPQAFKAFYESVNFEDAIRKAIIVGGDSDTIGAICGALASMYYGVPDYIYNDALSFLTDDLQKIYDRYEIQLL